MRKSTKAYLSELNTFSLETDRNCINTLQNTGWRINKNVLEVMKECWMSGVEWAGLPPRDNLPLPPYPFDKLVEEMNEYELEAFRDWKTNRQKIHRFNVKSMSKRIQMERMLQLAERYTQYPQFYYVWQMDFRGRKYPVDAYLTPQSADYGKALLEFAEATPMVSTKDARWLAIHGANIYGKDKISLDDRELWAYMQGENVAAVVADPFENQWWLDADKPWQCLAWCHEWHQWLTRSEGEAVDTRLACAQDGSCNGLQHLSAILRDEEGGRSVNLTPHDVPSDIYSDVAKAAIKRLEQDAAEGHNTAKQLLEFGIDRSITKRPVMIVPYAGTLFACRDYIMEALEEKVIKSGVPAPWGNEFFMVANYLASHVWAAISEVIESASQVMKYIQYIGTQYAKANMPMDWYTPTGFLVRQAYPDLKRKRIKTHLNGSIIQLIFHEEIDDKINPSKTKAGASPNFIHSMDAAALTLTVNKCAEEGMRNFAMIHDSFGVPSPQSQRLAEILREEFVKMYTENDVLWELKTTAEEKLGIELDPPPAKGSLDLNQVLKSLYFFA